MTRSEEKVNPQPVEAPKHMHRSEAPLPLPLGAEAIETFSAWSIAEPILEKAEKVSMPVSTFSGMPHAHLLFTTVSCMSVTHLLSEPFPVQWNGSLVDLPS
jgi:hypothetical protein